MGKRRAASSKGRFASYASSHRRERNKVRRLNKHLARHPQDMTAWAAQKSARTVAGV